MVSSVAVLTALGISKEVWKAVPEEDRKKITKAVVEGNIALAKKMLAACGVIKKAGSDNPTMEKEGFNPIEKACADAFDRGWLGDKHFNIEKFGIICQRRGLIGTEVWNQKDLSLPLGLFAKEAKGMDDERIDALLDSFAEAIDFDANLMKRHFYAIRFNYEDQFLADIEKREKKLMAEKTEKEASQ